MSDVQDKANRAALEILTPQQMSQLKKVKQEGFRSLGNPVQLKKKD